MCHALFQRGEGIIDLSAPGGNTSGLFQDGGITSTLPDNTYGALCGTSMAAPQVSGLAAMLLALDPNLSVDEVLAKLTAHCDNPNSEWSGYIGAGRVNAASLFSDYIATPTMTPTISPTSTMSPTCTVTPSITVTPTISATFTVSPTCSTTPTATMTVTPFAMAKRQAIFYPQPSRDRLNLALHISGQAQVTITLYNVAGEQVLNYTAQPYANGGTSMMQLNCSSLSPGMYYTLIQVIDDEGTWQVKKKIVIIK